MTTDRNPYWIWGDVELPNHLLTVLRDRSIHVEFRDDAAMDLGDFDEPAVEQALIEALSFPEEDATVADSCATSLVEIWSRQDRVRDPGEIASISPRAAELVRAYLQGRQSPPAAGSPSHGVARADVPERTVAED
jgi:hypothetical protein